MPNFCIKCGKENKEGIKFCTNCGAVLKIPAPAPVAPTPPPKGKSGFVGCLVGCLVVILVFLLLIGTLIGVGYYFISKMKNAEPGDYFEIDAKSKAEEVTLCASSLSCLNDNLEKCSRAKGETDFGEFATVEFEIMGTSGKSCVIFAKIVEINELPEGANVIPDFILNAMLKDLSMECLVPQAVYSKGVEEVGEYIGDNMADICEGPLFDMADKLGIDLEN